MFFTLYYLFTKTLLNPIRFILNLRSLFGSGICACGSKEYYFQLYKHTHFLEINQSDKTQSDQHITGRIRFEIYHFKIVMIYIPEMDDNDRFDTLGLHI